LTRELPPDRLWQPTTARWFAAIFGAALLYAVVRYHLAGDVAWRHFPLFILNKATSLAAVGFVAASYLVGKVIRWYGDDRPLQLVVIKFCGLMGFFLAVVHAFMAVCLLRPGYFAKFFDDAGRLNLPGELGMATGIVALLCLSSPAITTLPSMPRELGGWRWKRTQRLGYVALVFVAVHIVALGLQGWLAPRGWHGGLPPISLLAFVGALVPLLVKRRSVEERKAQRESAQQALEHEERE
jgi:DMSO/TMAO reductase YedYZ heme-binding membrane subunit